MNFAPCQWRAGEGYLPPNGSKPNPIFTMPAYPYMPYYGAPMPGAWAPPFPGNPYGPVLAAPPVKSAKAPSTAPPKPPAPSAKKSPPTQEKTAALATGVHFVSLHPTIAKLPSVKCGESSPGGDRVITLEEWQKFCNATDGTKTVDKEASLKNRMLAAGTPNANAEPKSVSSADFGSDFNAFLEWNRLRKEAKEAQKKADDAKVAVKKDKTASEVAAKSKSKSKSKAKSSEKSSAAHSNSNTYAPPTIRPGVNYLFPEKTSHTMLHVFNKTSKVWEPKYAGTKEAREFKIFKVATHFSVGEIIERVRGGKDEEKCKGWGVTEVVEVGGGGWKKGTTITYGDDKAKGTLESMGWDARRGSEGRPPVWLVVHKV